MKHGDIAAAIIAAKRRREQNGGDASDVVGSDGVILKDAASQILTDSCEKETCVDSQPDDKQR